MIKYIKTILTVGALGWAAVSAHAQGTAFSYQGQLKDGSSPANGAYDLKFSLFNAVTAGAQQGVTVTNLATAVTNGQFNVTLDFGSQFTGASRWLELGVRTNGGGAFGTLAPRQPVLPTPYAIHAESVDASGLIGQVTDANLSATFTSPHAFTNAGNSFAGNGSGLTALNGSQITSGTVADARLSTNVALLNGNNRFTGANNTFASRATVTNSGSGLILFAANPQGQFSFDGFLPGLGTTLLGNFTSYSTNAPQIRFSEASSGLFMDIGQNANQNFVVEGNDVPRLVVQNGGNVGIGTVQPNYNLEVNGPGDTEIAVKSSTPNGRTWTIQSSHPDAAFGNGTFQIIDRTAGVARLLIATNGNVGLGAGFAPTAKLDVRGFTTINGAWGGNAPLEVYGVPGGQYCRSSTMSQFTPTGVNTGIGGCPSCCPISDISIYAQNGVWASIYYAVSDARTKVLKGQSDAAADLALLKKIQVTDYTYIDKIAKGNGEHKKVIAQQLEKVFPQAVRQSTGEVPDIYKAAKFVDGWVQLKTNLKVGERVKLISDNEQGVYEVLEVRNGSFRTAFKPSAPDMFVFGREVKDFRTVDYEAVSMLNVSATQELARQVEAQQVELKKLQAKLGQQLAEKETLLKHLAALEARDRAREDRLAQIESSLQKGSTKYAAASRR